jgi:hypothetical protein
MKKKNCEPPAGVAQFAPKATDDSNTSAFDGDFALHQNLFSGELSFGGSRISC